MMSTKLRKLFAVLAVIACLAAPGLIGAPASAADWPGDIGPKQHIVKSTTVDMASAGQQTVASETAGLKA